jgi:hypothetical protein
MSWLAEHAIECFRSLVHAVLLEDDAKIRYSLFHGKFPCLFLLFCIVFPDVILYFNSSSVQVFVSRGTAVHVASFDRPMFELCISLVGHCKWNQPSFGFACMIFFHQC